MTTTKVKYFTKDLLMSANRTAIRTNRNRSLYQEKLAELPDLRFPVGFTMIHNEVEMRVEIAIGADADNLQTVWLDIPFRTYNALPEVEVME
jgi:hypothetical protein